MLLAVRKKTSVMWSTVLFINEKPVGYTITKEKDKYLFAPSEHSQTEEQAPAFFVILRNGVKQIIGLNDERLIEEAKLALEVIMGDDHQTLSAAV